MYKALRAQIQTQVGDESIDLVSVPFGTGVGSKIDALRHIRDKHAKVIIYAGTSDFVQATVSQAAAMSMIYPNSTEYTWIGFDNWNPPIPHGHGSLRMMASGCPGGPTKSPLIQTLQAVDNLNEVGADHVQIANTTDALTLPTRFSALGTATCQANFGYDAGRLVWYSTVST
jgi:hypothetical protein